jgi:hypothetical protein
MAEDSLLLQKIDAIAKINTEIINRIQAKKKVCIGAKYEIKIAALSKKKEAKNDGEIKMVDRRRFLKANPRNNTAVHQLDNYVLHTTTVEKEVKLIKDQWILTCSFTPIEDLFNDKLNFGCKTFEQIVTLNRDMLRVAQKYKMFGGSQPAIEALKLFLTNL